MEAPELLLLFSDSGPATVRVKLRGDQGRIGDRAMEPTEIAALVTPDGRGFHRYLQVDGYAVKVIRYEVDPQQSRLTVVGELVPHERESAARA